MSDMLDEIQDSLRAQGQRLRDQQRQAEAQAQLAAEYRTVDRKALSKMSDKALAEWQSRYPPGSPQFILAEYEWQRRLTVAQVRASRFAALMALLGAVVGAWITWLTSK
ncbi:MAG: hypothetical protein PXX73_04670 [Sideroxydans sp.]|nr:hypothetical protein [Sideroxydans sp.]